MPTREEQRGERHARPRGDPRRREGQQEPERGERQHVAAQDPDLREAGPVAYDVTDGGQWDQADRDAPAGRLEFGDAGPNRQREQRRAHDPAEVQDEERTHGDDEGGLAGAGGPPRHERGEGRRGRDTRRYR